MNECYGGQCIRKLDKIEIQSTLNDYFHLLQFSEENVNFEYIHDYIDCNCSLNTCKIFQRAYRDQNKSKSLSNGILSVKDSIKMQILDKIHCFYAHSYDIGYRLRSNEILQINDIKTKAKGENAKYLVSQRILKMNQILTKRRRRVSLNRNMSKYNQMSKSKETIIYHFGYHVYYNGYQNEHK